MYIAGKMSPMYDFTIDTIEGYAWQQWRFYVAEKRRQREVIVMMSELATIVEEKFISNYGGVYKLLDMMDKHNDTLYDEVKIFDGTLSDAKAKLRQAFFVIQDIIEDIRHTEANEIK